MRLVYVCAAASLLGLALIYFAARNMQPAITPIGEITFELVGRPVLTSGFIVQRTNNADGHVFLTIEDDGARLQVPLFASFVNAFEAGSSQKAKLSELRKGSLVEVQGTVGEYRGALQVVPRKPDDLRILYDR
ncbi:MAG: OB-fold nucleic acid binding domain-containing protein [Candidatus Aenigmatarchaeota archaeon]